MHLILLLNFNTKLAVYPADEIELITLPSQSPSREPVPWGPGRPLCSCGLEKLSSWLVFFRSRYLSHWKLLSPAHHHSRLFFDAHFILLNV